MSFSRLTRKDLFKRVNHAGIGSAIQATDILDVVTKSLNALFPKDIASEVKALFFRNGTVTLETSSSIIAQEIRLQESELKRVINEALKKEVVTHFLWRISS